MLCEKCRTEMYIYKVTVKDGKKEITYRCPNKRCPNFGYKSERTKV